MRCYICNRVIDEPQYNEDHMDYDPCDTCQIIIDDLLASYEDQPAPDEDDTTGGYDPLVIEGLYPTTYDPFETGGA